MPNSIKDLFSQLLPLYHAEQERLKKEKEEGKCFNVFSALNMCSDEVRLHSRLLATLLNPKANHGLENEFLKLFLIALGLPEDYITYCKEQIVERPIGEVTEATGGRIDIILEDRGHAVIIENKIYAGDQPNQLLRYHNYGVKTFGENNFKLVYLTLYGNKSSPDSLGGENFEFIKFSYAQDVLKLLKKLMKSKPKSLFTAPSKIISRLSNNLPIKTWIQNINKVLLKKPLNLTILMLLPNCYCYRNKSEIN